MFLLKWVGTSNTKINVAMDYIIRNTKITTSGLCNLEPIWKSLLDYIIRNPNLKIANTELHNPKLIATLNTTGLRNLELQKP